MSDHLYSMKYYYCFEGHNSFAARCTEGHSDCMNNSCNKLFGHPPPPNTNGMYDFIVCTYFIIVFIQYSSFWQL